MKKISWKRLIICILISSIIPNMGKFLQNFEGCDQDYPLGLSNFDSWSKIVKEEGCIYPTYCELVNGSLYIIGHTYVSKFNTSGIKEWELYINSDYGWFSSYVFDNDNNFIVLNGDQLSIIKFNSSGALLFSKEINQYPYGVSLVLGENNSLLIIGADYYYNRLFIMKFNNAGQFLWNTSFDIDHSIIPPVIVTDSGYNMYLSFRNNSIYNLAKINSSGAIVWQIGLENNFHKLMVDSNDNLFIMGSKILKLNSTGNQIKEILIENYITSYGEIWYLNDLYDLLVFNKYDMSILCYDLNLELKWNFSLSDYATAYPNLRTYLAKDSHDNVYIIQNNELGNIILVKISSTGEFLSRIIWGGFFNEEPRSLIIDLDNNIYFICKCDYYNVWGQRYKYTVLVKNPVNGGTPPKPRGSDLDLRDYFLFSVVGIACIISPIVLLSILRSKKKRIGL